MRTLRTLPAIFSLTLLAAHYLRAGRMPLVALSLGLALLALVHRRWASRVTRLALVAGSGVWVGTLVAIVGSRRSDGEPWGRTASILAAVALLALASAVVLPRGRTRQARVTCGGDQSGVAASPADPPTSGCTR